MLIWTSGYCIFQDILFNKRPNSQIIIEYKNLGICIFRYFGLGLRGGGFFQGWLFSFSSWLIATSTNMWKQLKILSFWEGFAETACGSVVNLTI